MRLARRPHPGWALTVRLAILLTAAAAPAARADSYYCTGDNAGAGNSWSAVAGLGGTNWSLSPDFNSGSPGLPGATDDVFFYLNPVNLNTVLGQDFSIRSLNFLSNSTSPVTVGGTNLLTIGAGGITV